MLAPVFPEWLPSSVAREAQRILDTDAADTALVRRLATDERMQPVWNEFKKYKPVRPRISEALSSMRRWSIKPGDQDQVDVDPPQESDALALFFWAAYTIASLKPAVRKVSRKNLPIAKYKQAAAALRWAAAEMNLLSIKYNELFDSRWESSDGHTKHIEAAAKFCEEAGTALARADLDAPLIIKRDHGNREARGYVRMLAIETRKLFGMTAPWRTLASVASVALMKEITDSQVRKWCDSLDKDNA